MNRRVAGVLLPVLLLDCVAVASTQAQEPMSAAEAAVRALDDQERAAVLHRDLAALERLWSDSLVVNAPGNRVTIGKRAVLDLVRRGLIHYASFVRQIEFIRLDGDIAIVMGAETVQPIGQAPMAGQTVARRFTHIWRRDAGTWHLIARHANVISPR